MIITKTSEGGKTVFLIEGRLDTTTAPELQGALIPEFEISKDIELDFEKLQYVSSAGLRVLLMGEKAAKAKSGTLTLRNVLPEIMEVFDMTGFSAILTIA